MNSKDQASLLESQIRVYRELYLKHGRSEEALCWSKNKQENRFEALTRHIPNSSSILLDYGCGLGDLKTWLSTSKSLISYKGVDIVSELIDSNKKALGAEYFSTIAGPEDVAYKFDHGILSGVFNQNRRDQRKAERERCC